MIDLGTRTEFMDNAARQNVFTPLITEYIKKDFTDPNILDELLVALQESEAVKTLRQTLEEESPAFTSVYRYDPFSIKAMGKDGCFSNKISIGAGIATAWVFSDLRPEDVRVVRTSDEALVIIDHPATRISNSESQQATEEPVVLFTSRQLLDYRSTQKTPETEIGLVISHGESPIQCQPPAYLASSVMMSGYASMTLAQLRTKQNYL